MRTIDGQKVVLPGKATSLAQSLRVLVAPASAISAAVILAERRFTLWVKWDAAGPEGPVKRRMAMLFTASPHPASAFAAFRFTLQERFKDKPRKRTPSKLPAHARETDATRVVEFVASHRLTLTADADLAKAQERAEKARARAQKSAVAKSIDFDQLAHEGAAEAREAAAATPGAGQSAGDWQEVKPRRKRRQVTPPPPRTLPATPCPWWRQRGSFALLSPQ